MNSNWSCALSVSVVHKLIGMNIIQQVGYFRNLRFCGLWKGLLNNSYVNNINIQMLLILLLFERKFLSTKLIEYMNLICINSIQVFIKS